MPENRFHYDHFDQELFNNVIERITKQYDVWRKILHDSCESPIEEMFVDGFLTCGQILPTTDFRVLKDGDRFDNETMLQISPQYQVGKYRLDFGVKYIQHNLHVHIAVECDGHDFHEKTKEQAARDKKRDRYFQVKGWHVLRFTGSEIHKNKIQCANEVFDLIETIFEKDASRLGKTIGDLMLEQLNE